MGLALAGPALAAGDDSETASAPITLPQPPPDGDQPAGEAGEGAAPAAPAAVFTVPSVEVVGTTPVQGVGIEKKKVPSNVQTVPARTLDRPGAASLADILNSSVGSVTVNEVTVNPFQPDVNFRGFTASPLLGVPQGIAIYQNGVRVNEPFGDTVQWDVVPEFAINQVQVIPGANPVFGLNALGGAIALQMKNGFNFDGASAEAYGGSWDRKQGTLEYGTQVDDMGFYIGGTGFDETGWRDFSPSKVGQVYSDARWRGDDAEAGISFGYAATNISGVQPAPVQLLQQDWAAAFTAPDHTKNDLVAVTADGTYFASDTLTLNGNMHYRRLHTRGLNSNVSDYADCTGIGGPPGTLCENAGTVDEMQILDTGGNPIPTSVGGDGVDVTNSADAEMLGGTLQSTLTEELFGLPNQFIAGFAADFATVNYRNEGNIGFLNGERYVIPSGIFIGGDEFNTRLDTTNMYLGAYFADTLSVTDDLAVTLSGRYNYVTLKLDDQLGTALNGEHKFIRFNPALGATYQFAGDITGYANYSEANRAPTAVELSCADPAQPCRVPNAFLADPSLGQVVNRSVEMGARGRFNAFDGEIPVNWSAAIFGSRNYDDIIFVSTGAGSGGGYFQNAGITQRLGSELQLNGTAGSFDWFVDYTFTRATFESNLTIASPFNPAANANGDILVKPGDRIPSIPLHSIKAGIGYNVTEDWNVSVESMTSSQTYFRGDEANLLSQVPGYTIFNLRSSYDITDYLQAFVKVNNIFDSRYESFGTLGDPTEVFPNFTDPRFESPGSPIGAWAGLRVNI